MKTVSIICLLLSVLLHVALVWMTSGHYTAIELFPRRGAVVVSMAPISESQSKSATKPLQKSQTVRSLNPTDFNTLQAPSAAAVAEPTSPPGLSDGSEFGVIAPEYPETARVKGEEGEVLVRVRWNAPNTITDANLEKTSGFVALDRAAVLAVKRLISKKQESGNHETTIRFVFTLH